MLFRYRAWDGTQEVDPLTAEELLEALADEILDNGDIEAALHNVLRYGDQGRINYRIEGIQKLLERLREQRKEQLQRYNTNSILDDIAKRLEQILQHEREAIEERRQRASKQEGSPSEQSPSSTTPLSAPDSLPARSHDQSSPTDGSFTGSTSSFSPSDQRMRDVLRRLADQKESELNQLPPDVPGRIRQLQNYEFLSPQAQGEFQQLLDELRGQMAEQYFQGLSQAIGSLTPEDLQRLRDMVRDLNKLLDSALQGQSPDASDFLQKFGDFFPGARSLEDILQQLAQRAKQMNALMNTLSREQRSQLQQMLSSLFRDDRLQWDMARLAASLNQLLPREARGYHFSGDESLSLREALRLMEQLQQMDTLEQQLQRAQRQGTNAVDPDLVEQTLGREAREQLEQMNSLARILEDAGFIRRRGDRLELTARGVRRIGQKALHEIFTALKKDRLGNHDVATQGRAGERGDDCKAYEFGDPFLLDLQGTVRHAILRQGPRIPVQLQPGDFEVYRTEHRTEVSTVLMIDLSRSMLYNGCYAAAKRVTLALNALIASQYPRDALYIVGFADRARQLKPEDLSTIDWNEERYGTNLQHALQLARHLLSRHKAGTRQIIVITDGEPTAHTESDGSVFFHFPPAWNTLQETLREVVRCTRDRLVINTFMLERGRYLTEFIDHLTRLNRGRAFYATPERLGEYILVDYVRNKRKRIA